MAVTFADVKHPAPNALFERMAAAMERYVHHSTINGQSVGGRCLGNVNDVFRSIGGTPRYLSGSGYDQASDVAKALRGKADKTNAPPRGAICLWDNTGGGGADGHIAVADGKGNSVNNWATSTIVRTALTRQRGGYVGWVSPALLGSGVSNGAQNANADYDGSGGVDDLVYPLPGPQHRAAWSAISMPMLWSGKLSLLDGKRNASVGALIDSVTLDAGTESVAQLTLVSHDPDLALSRSKLADIGTTLKWSALHSKITSMWDVSTVDVSAASTTVTIAARSMLAKRLRRRVDVRSARKVSPSEWVTRHVEGAGGEAIVQKSSRRGEISQGDGVTEWDMLSGLASDLGWSFIEYGGTVVFGSRHWAWSGGPNRNHWQATWVKSRATDVLDAQLSQTSDDDENTAVGSIVLPWNRGILVEPWDTVQLSGLGRWDGVWLVENVSATTDRSASVELQLAQPKPPSSTSGTTSTSSSTLSSTPPTKDKKSVKYAKWYARQVMAAKPYGWGSDEQWAALENLWERESGWNYQAENSSSGAYGIPQALPASKMKSAGSDWKTNPETQIKWGLSYIKDRYGGPKRAWAAWNDKGWY